MVNVFFISKLKLVVLIVNVVNIFNPLIFIYIGWTLIIIFSQDTMRSEISGCISQWLIISLF